MPHLQRQRRTAHTATTADQLQRQRTHHYHTAVIHRTGSERRGMTRTHSGRLCCCGVCAYDSSRCGWNYALHVEVQDAV